MMDFLLLAIMLYVVRVSEKTLGISQPADGGFQYPNSWMVEKMGNPWKSQRKMHDDWGVPPISGNLLIWCNALKRFTPWPSIGAMVDTAWNKALKWRRLQRCSAKLEENLASQMAHLSALRFGCVAPGIHVFSPPLLPWLVGKSQQK